MKRIIAFSMLMSLFVFSNNEKVHAQSQAEKSLSDILKNPIDLKDFKKSHGGAHSGPINRLSHLYFPETGSHYNYFYFKAHRLKGAVRKSARREFVQKKDFRIVSFVYGKLTGEEQYLNMNETLVEIQCTIKDPLLGILNIVGFTKSEMRVNLGETTYKTETQEIYTVDDRLLLAKYQDDKVSAFKYMRLKKSFVSSDTSDQVLMNRMLVFSDK